MFTTVSKIILIVLIGGSVSFIPKLNECHPVANNKSAVKWIVEKSSTLRVLGRSNVNQFSCEINGYYKADTFFCEKYAANGKAIRLSGSLEIDILKFDCHSKFVTADLRKTLKSKDYPKLFIRFLSLERMPAFNNGSEKISGSVEIELAGVPKVFEICYEFVNQGVAPFGMNGSQIFSLADFNLVPPKKFAGLIKVRDKFQVDFHLRLISQPNP